MKKILPGFILICLITFSCKKDHKAEIGPNGSAQNGTGARNITFNVGFAKTITNFETTHLKLNSNSTDTALTNHIGVLYFMVFDSLGNNLHTITQRDTAAAFGKFTDNLRSGKYTVIIVGGNSKLQIGLDRTITGSTMDKTYIYYPADPSIWGDGTVGMFSEDTFCKKVSLTVTNTDSNENIALDRITSKLEININDAIPTGAGYLNFEIRSTADAFYVNTGNAGVIGARTGPSNIPIFDFVDYSAVLTGADAGVTNYKTSFLFLYYKPFTVFIDCTTSKGYGTVDSKGTVFSSKILQNVTAQANKITLLSGNLFGGSGNGGTPVSADTTWNAPITAEWK